MYTVVAGREGAVVAVRGEEEKEKERKKGRGEGGK